MRKLFFTAICLVLSVGILNAKKVKQPKISGITGALLVVQNDKFDNRFSAEVNMGKIFSLLRVPLLLSVNLIKEGNPLTEIASQRVNGEMAAKGINTVLIVSVRGYDTRFKPRTIIPETLEEMLKEGNLYPLVQNEVASVTIEFFQYVGGVFKGYEMMRIGGASDKQKLYKRLQKRLERRIPRWMS
jgi:hypothetical protein